METRKQTKTQEMEETSDDKASNVESSQDVTTSRPVRCFVVTDCVCVVGHSAMKAN